MPDGSSGAGCGSIQAISACCHQAMLPNTPPCPPLSLVLTSAAALHARAELQRLTHRHLSIVLVPAGPRCGSNSDTWQEPAARWVEWRLQPPVPAFAWSHHTKCQALAQQASVGKLTAAQCRRKSARAQSCPSRCPGRCRSAHHTWPVGRKRRRGRGRQLGWKSQSGSSSCCRSVVSCGVGMSIIFSLVVEPGPNHTFAGSAWHHSRRSITTHLELLLAAQAA